ncbi:probable prolyl 4-hydroxylase 7 [Ananas comosus]|uniref:procollagen-proline 4-dioxygenase n=1 Tax=Ananas comosus TaxID=4615 RepID=A0A6P5F7Z8_ANACO|nr:probable prolyl 4-hydroxylase 7 [Ananas comosus]
MVMGLGFRCALAVLSLLFVVSLTLVLREETSGGPVAFDPARVTQVSWKPRVFLYKRFLSDEECDHLIKLAKSKLAKSMVADNESGKSVMSNVRTSSGMFLMKRQDAIVARIEQRIAAWTFLPEENAEPIQVLRYGIGQKYEPHFDYFYDQINQVRGGHRAATVLMYLSDVEKGGETVFPNAEGWESQPKDDSWSDCARGGYAVKPTKGDAVLFFSLNIDSTTDPHSLHGSCPVIEGEKWSAPKWIHVRSYDKLEMNINSGRSRKCSDENVMCPQWAAAGECLKNSLYMVGINDTHGFCRKSCGICDS